MKKESTATHVINSISEFHRILELPKPAHPLISLVNYDDLSKNMYEASEIFFLNFYMICLKRNFKGKLKYGQHHYDFDEGVLSFISPNQVIGTSEAPDGDYSGFMLLIHPDFIRSYSLGTSIKKFGFFSYAVNEALHLSEAEEKKIIGIMKNIEEEYLLPVDLLSQDVLVSHIELLLNYSNRYYNRQFITRKNASNDLLTRFENLLQQYFETKENESQGLPAVKYFSEKLYVSSGYLSDMLRTLTHQNTQQHIHNKIIDIAKEKLLTTSLTVSEIAYKLGFDYPQSFNKLFKNKTHLSPLEFRQSFN